MYASMTDAIRQTRHTEPTVRKLTLTLRAAAPQAAVSRVSMDGGGSALRGKGEDLGSNDPKHSSVSYKMTGETGSYR